MYLNVTINDRVKLTFAPVSIAEMRAIQKATSAKYALLVIVGATQVKRVVDEGDAQVARVVTTGDEQVVRLEEFEDLVYDFVGDSEAEALNSNSWANEPLNADVLHHTWNPVTNLIESAPLVGSRSAFHWQEIAKTLSSGMNFLGTWDSVDCSLPPTPTPELGELADGSYYIVKSVSGDTALCPDISTGDWLVWTGDQVGDGTVEGSWQLINWAFAWNAITDVTIEGSPTVNGDDLARFGTSYTKVEQDIIDGTQNDAIALNSAKVGITTAQADAIAVNTAKVGVTDSVTNGLTPIGGVIMYDGLFSAIPANWQLVNVDGKFIMGTSVEADVGVTGGSNDAVVVSHGHTFSGDVLAPHKHDLITDYIGTAAGSTGVLKQSGAQVNSDRISNISAGTPSGTVETSGVDGVGKNAPSYIKMGFIKRIS